MISGESVVVEHLGDPTEDAMGDITYGEKTLETVEDVLVQVGSTNELSDNVRPDGVTVTYTLHFPKGYDTDLTGLRIQVRGEWLRVIGSPRHYTLENTPTRWWMPVEVERTDG